MRFEQIRIRAVGKVLAEWERGQYMDPDHAAVICCTDEPLDKGALSTIRHFCVQFYDTEKPEDVGCFTREQAAAICAFIHRLPDTVSCLYCCCDWGQSRSAGLAAAILTTQGKPCEPVFLNPSYRPNLLVYAYMCEAFGCGSPSKERLAELDGLRNHKRGKTGYTLDTTAKRIVLVGDASYLDSWLGTKVWPELQPCPIMDCRSAGKTIPYEEEELIADKHELDFLSWGDVVLVMLGPGDLHKGRPLKEIKDRMRKYLYWLRYDNSGATFLLVSPLCCPEKDGLGQELVTALDECFSVLANEIGLGFLNVDKEHRLPL